jgi:hypothetical protein
MNWGTKIVIALGAFISFILALGIFMMASNKEGVEANYYEKDLLYEQEIQAQRNLQAFSGKTSFKLQDDKIVASFPKEIQNYKGKIWLIRPNDARKDRTIEMNLDEKHQQVIEKEHLQEGIWKVYATWEMGGKQYQSEKFDFFINK